MTQGPCPAIGGRPSPNSGAPKAPHGNPIQPWRVTNERACPQCAVICSCRRCFSRVAVWQRRRCPHYNLGRPPTEQELRPADALIRAKWRRTPTWERHRQARCDVYLTRGCAGCHGSTGTEGPAPRLVGLTPFAGADEAASHAESRGGREVRRGARHLNWPFAPLLWSWINVGMPLNQHGYLTPDEVYSLTAYILYRNGIIQEGDKMDADTLPRVEMPNRKAYVPPPFSEWKPGLRGR